MAGDHIIIYEKDDYNDDYKVDVYYNDVGTYAFILIPETETNESAPIIRFTDDGGIHGNIYTPDETRIHGRLWTKRKFIAFWDYDFADIKLSIKKKDEDIKHHHKLKQNNKMTFRETLKFISDEFNKTHNNKININDEWKIDVPVSYSDDTPSYEVYGHDYSLMTLNEFEKVGGANIDIESSEESRAIHLMNYAQKQKMKEKGWGRGWGSDMSKGLAWKQAKYVESFSSFKLFENPDHIESENGLKLFNKEKINHLDYDSVTFGYDKETGKMITGRFNYITHSDLCDDRCNMEYPGRLWLDTKCISFWLYPPKEELRQVLKDIEDSYNEGFEAYLKFYYNFEDKKIYFQNNKQDKKYKFRCGKKCYFDTFEIVGCENGEYEYINDYYDEIKVKYDFNMVKDWIKNADIDKLERIKTNTSFILIPREKLNITDDWYIEVRKSVEQGEKQNKYWSTTRELDYIKIGDYAGSLNVNDEEIKKGHLDWKEKKKLKDEGKIKVLGGSKLTEPDSTNPLIWRQAKYVESLKNESKKFDGIFTDAVWQNDEGDSMVLRVTGNKVYGSANSFDFERNTKAEAFKQLLAWGYKYVGVD